VIVEEPHSICWSAARLARQHEVALAVVDLSSAQYRMLVQHVQGAEAASALARKLAVSPPTVSTVVDGLVQRGAIERTYSIDDRRRVSLTLTRVGEELLDSANEAVQARLQSIVSELDDDSLEAAAIYGLSLWGEALDRARKRRLALPLDPSRPMP